MTGAPKSWVTVEKSLPSVVAVGKNQIDFIQNELRERVVLEPSFNAVEEENHARCGIVQERKKLEEVEMPNENDLGASPCTERLQNDSCLGAPRPVGDRMGALFTGFSDDALPSFAAACLDSAEVWGLQRGE